jgi:chemotaxis protein methyltransferase CheR
MDLLFDPELLLRLRERVVPDLRTWPWPTVWVEGCGAGELAYAVAILLREEGLLARTTLYATAPDDDQVAAARTGVYAKCNFERAEVLYRAAGGRASLAEYCRDEGHGVVRVRPALRERMAFFQHDPRVDGSPNEFQLIVSGAALDRWPPEDATRVLSLYHASLCRFGALALVHGDSLALHPRRSSYVEIIEGGHLHRRMR